MFNKGLLEVIFGDIFADYEEGAQTDLPKGGVDRRFHHACRCFVRVGHCRFGCILKSMLDSWYALLGAIIAPSAVLERRDGYKCRFGAPLYPLLP